MATWLIVILLSYLFFSISFFGDKLMLSGPPNPKSYTFYVGLLNISVLVLTPFVQMVFPGIEGVFWVILTALTYVLGMYFMFSTLEDFEVSQVMPTVGALQPIFILLLTWIFFSFQSIVISDFIAFAVLVVGGVFVSLEESFTLSKRYAALVTASAFLFSLNYIFSKFVFLEQPFLQGLIFIGVATSAIALLLLLDPVFRRQVFAPHAKMGAKHGIMFFSFQSSGAAAGFLQSFAIALVPVGYLAIMNSLRGIQYVFLFAITLFFSLMLPSIFTERVSMKIIAKKAFSILLIAVGLAILVLH